MLKNISRLKSEGSPTFGADMLSRLGGVAFIFAFALVGGYLVSWKLSAQTAVVAPADREALGAAKQSYDLGGIKAYQSILIGRSAQTEAQWHRAANLWQEAIQLMQAVPPNTPEYTLAQLKIAEYQSHLIYAKDAELKASAFRLGTNQATEAFAKSQIAKTEADWQEAVSWWQSALKLMQAVPKYSADYQRAQEKISEYEANLRHSQKEVQKAGAFRMAVKAATEASALVQSAKTSGEWSLVANLWSKAIDLMKSVPPGSDNYITALEKVWEYQAKLKYAKQKSAELQAVSNASKDSDSDFSKIYIPAKVQNQALSKGKVYLEELFSVMANGLDFDDMESPSVIKPGVYMIRYRLNGTDGEEKWPETVAVFFDSLANPLGHQVIVP